MSAGDLIAPTSISLSSSYTDTEILSLLSNLETYLPYSLPLYRRLQFHLAHPSDPALPPHAQIFQASAHDVGSHAIEVRSIGNSTASPTDDYKRHDAATEARTPWLAAHVDLSRSGETQIWIFANWECSDKEDHESSNQQQVLQKAQELEARQSLVQYFFRWIYTRCVPLLPVAAPASFNSVKSHYADHHPYSPSAVLLGSCSVGIRSLIPDCAIRRVDSTYLKYIFRFDSYEHASSGSMSSTQGSLPPGYRYGALRKPGDLQLALDRTHIPRTVDTLAMLPSRAVFYQDGSDPVAWGFLGLDSSLTSLYTEPQHRRKDLASLLTRELLRMQHEHFKTSISRDDGHARPTDDGIWGHADVSENNLSSRRMMEKAGGRMMWKGCWVEVELNNLFGGGGLWSGT